MSVFRHDRLAQQDHGFRRIDRTLLELTANTLENLLTVFSRPRPSRMHAVCRCTKGTGLCRACRTHWFEGNLCSLSCRTPWSSSGGAACSSTHISQGPPCHECSDPRRFSLQLRSVRKLSVNGAHSVSFYLSTYLPIYLSTYLPIYLAAHCVT